MRATSKEKKKAKDTLKKAKSKVVAMPQLINELSAPDQLSEGAKVEWNEIASTLSSDQLLTGLDRKILMMYCEEMAKYWKLQVDLGAEDIILELMDGKGKVINYMKNPKLDLSDKALKNAHVIGLHFGLTPLSRTKINVTSKKESTPEQKNLDSLSSLRNKVVKMKSA